MNTGSPNFNLTSLTTQNNNRINHSNQGNRSAEMSTSRMQQNNEEDDVLEEKYYVMRLYGRNINLGKFRHDTNLYPVCRDWVANQLQLQHRSAENGLENKTSGDQQQETKNYYKLPPPIPLEPGVLSLRVPSTSPVVKQGINIDYSSENSLPSKQELLKGHLKNWTNVRKKWMNAYADDEKRYYKSKRILKRMYDRTEEEF